MTDNITLRRALVEEVRELIRIAVYSPYGSEFRDPYKHQQAALAALDAALAEPNAIARAVEAEREACAKLCDGWTHADGDRCADAIRARGSK
jgi:hypothetical protein